LFMENERRAYEKKSDGIKKAEEVERGGRLSNVNAFSKGGNSSVGVGGKNDLESVMGKVRKRKKGKTACRKKKKIYFSTITRGRSCWA